MSSYETKLAAVKELFSSCTTPEERYKIILDISNQLPAFASEAKLPCNLVEGCQSLMYVDIFFEEDKFYFTAYSEALISKGLAALLHLVYNGEPAENILKYPPLFLKELKILPSLSPSRANGVASLFSKLQKAAIKFLSTQNL